MRRAVRAVARCGQDRGRGRRRCAARAPPRDRLRPLPSYEWPRPRGLGPDKTWIFDFKSSKRPQLAAQKDAHGRDKRRWIIGPGAAAKAWVAAPDPRLPSSFRIGYLPVACWSPRS